MKIIRNISKGISFVFSPLIIPTYAIALMFGVTELAFVPFLTRLITVGVVFFLTCLAPMVVIGVMRKMNKVSDVSLTQRKDRLRPFCWTLVFYIMTIVYLYAVGGPHWLVGFMIGATVGLACVSLVSCWWKISAHATAVGGLLAAVVSLSMHAVFPLGALVMLTIVMMIAGLVGVARLLLQSHTPMQIYAGYAVGFVFVYLFSNLLNF